MAGRPDCTPAGQTILELAAGPGETGFLAAERVGPGGRLISTDLSPGMVEAARRGAAARGLGNVECRVMDAERIDLLDDGVDGVLCRFALMLMPEPHRALREVSRVLRDGGRLAYAVFGRPERNPWITSLARAIDEAGQHVAGDPFGPDGPFFSLAEPHRNRDLLDGAGFSDMRVEEIAETRRYDGFDDYWDHHSHATPPVAALCPRCQPEASSPSRRRCGRSWTIPGRHRVRDPLAGRSGQRGPGPHCALVTRSAAGSCPALHGPV